MLNLIRAHAKRRWWRYLSGMLIFWFVSATLWAPTLSPTYENCQRARQAATSKSEQPEFHKQLAGLIVCEGEFAEKNNGAITGVATIFVAIFTFTLWFVTGSAVHLARTEFSATHRPAIIVHSVEYIPNASNSEAVKIEMLGASVTIFNRGDTPATKLRISGKIESISGRPAPGLTFPEIETQESAVPGIPYSFSMQSKQSDIAHRVDVRFDPKAGGATSPKDSLYCTGTVSYMDGLGNQRITGFCWRLYGLRWIRQSRSAYEYAY